MLYTIYLRKWVSVHRIWLNDCDLITFDRVPFRYPSVKPILNLQNTYFYRRFQVMCRVMSPLPSRVALGHLELGIQLSATPHSRRVSTPLQGSNRGYDSSPSLTLASTLMRAQDCAEFYVLYRSCQTKHLKYFNVVTLLGDSFKMPIFQSLHHGMRTIRGRRIFFLNFRG